MIDQQELIYVAFPVLIIGYIISSVEKRLLSILLANAYIYSLIPRLLDIWTERVWRQDWYTY